MKLKLKKLIILAVLTFPVAIVSHAQVELNDDAISDAVERAFRNDTIVPAYSIDLTVDDGVASLTGMVDNILVKERAGRIASTIRGVQGVVNMILVEPPIDRTNLEIRQDIRQALIENPATEAFEVSVEVDDGEVALFGEVESHRERQLVEKVAKSVKGVTAITNNIVLDYHEARTDTEIEKEVRQSLEWNARIDHTDLQVDVEDRVVTLEGAVASYAELQKATELAWVRGVEAVQADAIVIDPNKKRSAKPEPPSDKDTEIAVKAALILNPVTKAYNINVEVDDGVATLTGTVSSLNEKFEAEDEALQTSGVYAVKNELDLIFSEDLTELEIETDITQAFLNDPYLESYELQVHVDNGVATLQGEVETSFEKSWAANIASGVLGVTEVVNEIETDPVNMRPLIYGAYSFTWPAYQYSSYTTQTTGEPTTDEEIASSIESELFWSPFVDHDDIEVTVKNGIATMTGTVDSQFELNTAIANGLEGGARYVKNQLALTE